MVDAVKGIALAKGVRHAEAVIAKSNYVAESIVDLYRRRESIHGLTMTYEAPMLRHFTARFEELDHSTPVQQMIS